MLKKVLLVLATSFLCFNFSYGSTLSTSEISGKIISFTKRSVTFKQGNKKFTAPRSLFKKRITRGNFNLKLKNTKLSLIKPHKKNKKSYKRRSRNISSEN